MRSKDPPVFTDSDSTTQLKSRQPYFDLLQHQLGTEQNLRLPVSKIRPLQARQVEKILKNHGFVKVSQKGSHRKWLNPSTKKQTIVPYHSGKTLPRGTLKKIFQDAEIPESEWRM